MLEGEPDQEWDKQVYSARIECRKGVQRVNNSIPGAPEWEAATQDLMRGCENAYLEPPFRCDYGQNIKLGKNFYANFNCVILDVAEVTIGDNVLLGPHVQILTAGHPLDVKGRVEDGVEFGTPINVGDNVWLGGGVIICPGVTIGKNSVIGAGSVVTKDIPDNVVAVGNRCKVLKAIDNV